MRLLFILIGALVLSSVSAVATPIKGVKLNVVYIIPEVPGINVAPLEEQQANVYEAIKHLPVKVKLVKEVVAKDACTSARYSDDFAALLCYQRVARKQRLRTRKDTITLAITQTWPTPWGTWYYRGYAATICGLNNVDYGFAFAAMQNGDKARGVEWVRHELMHVLGASHDNGSANLMSQSLFVLAKLGEILPINKKAIKQTKFCHRRTGVKFVEAAK